MKLSDFYLVPYAYDNSRKTKWYKLYSMSNMSHIKPRTLLYVRLSIFLWMFGCGLLQSLILAGQNWNDGHGAIVGVLGNNQTALWNSPMTNDDEVYVRGTNSTEYYEVENFLAYWPIYLTHWSLCMLIVYLGLVTYTTYQASLEIERDPDIFRDDDSRYDIQMTQASNLTQVTEFPFPSDTEQQGQDTTSITDPTDVHATLDDNLELPPMFVRATALFQAFASIAALIVTLLYWTLVYEGKLVDFKNLNVHLFNFLCVTLEVFMGEQPVYLAHTVYTVIYFLVYLIWTGIHEATGIGNGYGDNWIYAVLDWESPTSAAVMCLIIFIVVVPLMSFLWVKGILLARARIKQPLDGLIGKYCCNCKCESPG